MPQQETIPVMSPVGGQNFQDHSDGNEAFVDYIERTEESARKHNATIDAAREANQQRPDAAGVSKP